MKKFIGNLIAISLLTLVVLAVIVFQSFSEIDSFYKKFTTPRQESLIMGTSRSAQGIMPSVLEQQLGKKFFNYSFTVDHSPYGPIYLNSIKNKIKTESKNGIFILAIDPWSISSLVEESNETGDFREEKLCLAYTTQVDVNPNFDYLFKNLFGKYTEAITFNKNKVYLHDDGWLEIDVPMNSASIHLRQEEKLSQYHTYYLPSYRFSDIRLEFLKQTVQFLKSHGTVYLVRLPLHPELFNIELEFLPDFEDFIAPVIELSDGYLDMTVENSQHIYTDGNHIYKESSKVVSGKIATWIRKRSNSDLRQTLFLNTQEN